MLMMMYNFLLSFKKEDGQGMVEYALIIGLVVIAVIAVLVLLGPAIADQFQEIVDSLTGA
ncbi:Flp family type IVb pilin [Acidaminobacter sp. JC074]|uniref:Flp family type IVb pilin n=1 Tax=Acidaminobacter sp. JC074 TaxID=2530199 RepID=UPI001F0E1D7D|nr:Flp family type IVb pilin [Acidaminobacter sp. JC074]